jgi:hypothetical protein
MVPSDVTHLDLIPAPEVIHRRIHEAAQAQRVLRQLLRVSLAAHRVAKSRVGDALPATPVPVERGAANAG